MLRPIFGRFVRFFGALPKLSPRVILFIVMASTIALGIAMLGHSSVQAALTCVNDTLGANDEPGQKDLTQLCIDDAGLPNTLQVTWNWDEISVSGNNTLDACS